jgi:hypothetical protein
VGGGDETRSLVVGLDPRFVAVTFEIFAAGPARPGPRQKAQQ